MTNFRLFQTKEFADDNFKFDENGRKFPKEIENTVWKRRNCSFRAISPFPHRVFKRLVLQTRKNQGLFGKGLKLQSRLLRNTLH